VSLSEVTKNFPIRLTETRTTPTPVRAGRQLTVTMKANVSAHGTHADTKSSGNLIVGKTTKVSRDSFLTQREIISVHE